MELQNKMIRKSLGAYILIVFFTVFINLIIYLYIPNKYIANVSFILPAKIQTLYTQQLIFINFKFVSINLILNILLLLIIEFMIICLFQSKLNEKFKIDNLFTIKKFILLAIVIILIQLVFSYWLWLI